MSREGAALMGTGQTPGNNVRFPGFDVLGRSDKWDPVTTGVVLRRLGPRPPLRFFTMEEEPTARALLDRLLANDEEPRIPLFELLDARLAQDATDGWRHEEMPHDTEAWRVSLRYLDQDADDTRGKRFHEVSRAVQEAIIEAVHSADDWHGLPAGWVWSLWTRYACNAFYSHPWSWNEIGFGGPAYPVGYANLGLDGREHWEKPDAGPSRARPNGPNEPSQR